MQRRRVGLAVALVLPGLPAASAGPFPIENSERPLSSADTSGAAVEMFNARALGADAEVAHAALAQARCEKTS
jgi:hypothetical protein